MTKIDKLLRQLFATQRKHPHLPLVEEALTRSEPERQGFFRWQNEGHHQALVAQVYQAWQSKKQQQTSSLEVHLLKTVGANGLAISYQAAIGPRNFQHLFDWLRDRVGQLGYQHYSSDRRHFDREGYVETIEKHYLKPPLDLQTNGERLLVPCNQLYGNVLIEQVLIDRQPSFIRFQANFYQDHLYTPALPFDQLVHQVLG
jgi:hypothetical protein